MRSFMESNGLHLGLLFNADPHSRMIDENDPVTALRFGDAATVTLLSDRPKWAIGRCDLGTAGVKGRAMEVRLDLGGRLHVDRNALRDFAIERVPQSIARVLELNQLTIQQIDRIVVHQADRELVEALAKKVGAAAKLGFHAGDYGDTASSSIALVLEQNLDRTDRRVVLAGFGAGLSWASTVLTRVD